MYIYIQFYLKNFFWKLFVLLIIDDLVFVRNSKIFKSRLVWKSRQCGELLDDFKIFANLLNMKKRVNHDIYLIQCSQWWGWNTFRILHAAGLSKTNCSPTLISLVATPNLPRSGSYLISTAELRYRSSANPADKQGFAKQCCQNVFRQGSQRVPDGIVCITQCLSTVLMSKIMRKTIKSNWNDPVGQQDIHMNGT